MSDVPVTRHFSPEKRKNTESCCALGSLTLVESSPIPAPTSRFMQFQSFCDWVSIYQSHEGVQLPKINDGAFVRYDAHGAHESTTLKKFKVEGSHETGIFVRCDGETVWFEGNVSRFGRPDNVFGFTFEQCLTRIKAIISSMGLPPFTPGKRFRVTTFNGDKSAFTGARITRLDLTQNFQSGSTENAYAFMRHLSMQQASRLKTGTYGEGETVDFGRGSRRVYSKAYLKHAELLRHMRKQPKGEETQYSRPFDPYVSQLADWCASVGLVRFETTYKSTFLIDNFQNYLGGLDMPSLEQDFLQRQEVFTRANVDMDELSSLDKTTLGVYRMWQAGDDITTKLKKTQFYKHRSALLPFGVDIAIKSNVINFQPRVRVIKLSPAPMPAFYQLPQPSFIRLAA
jgi:hypothetical protein